MKSAGGHDAAALVAKFVRIATDFGVLEEICTALERGDLHVDSTAVSYGRLCRGTPQVEAAIAGLLKVWAVSYPAISASAIALTLRACAVSIQRERLHSPSLQVVWTGPSVDGSFVRATNEVVRELIGGASKELLIVGFWLIVKDNPEGPMREIIDRIFHAVEHGVQVTMVLDERKRLDGRDNKSTLLKVWPASGKRPLLLTWRLPVDDSHIKLHAKVLVADCSDALITSANLTDYAMTKNIEMGVRLSGQPAEAIVSHFKRLHEDGILSEL